MKFVPGDVIVFKTLRSAYATSRYMDVPVSNIDKTPIGEIPDGTVALVLDNFYEDNIIIVKVCVPTLGVCWTGAAWAELIV